MQSNKYFDQISAKYDQKLKKNFLWRLTKNQELTSVLGSFDQSFKCSVLELGCGSGYYANYLKNLGANVEGVDQSEEMLKIARTKSLTVHREKIEDLNLKTKFDVVLAAGSFEFLFDLGSGFSCVQRHLNSAGQFILLYPRGGFLGFLYQEVHKYWKCPTYLRSSTHVIDLARTHGLQLKKHEGAGVLAQLFTFTRNDD